MTGDVVMNVLSHREVVFSRMVIWLAPLMVTPRFFPAWRCVFPRILESVERCIANSKGVRHLLSTRDGETVSAVRLDARLLPV